MTETTSPAPKAALHRYLRQGREVLLWKLDGLSEYDVRRPLVPSGTNLLGLVKHLAGGEAGYLGGVFGRPFPVPMNWFGPGAAPNESLYATEQESRESLVDLYRRVAAHSDAIIDELPLDAPGVVPWWPAERRQVTLHDVLVHLIAETHRHAGHADLVRELVDGSVGLNSANSNLPPVDADWWPAQRETLEQLASRFR